jgi:hypothetical protein
MDKLKLKSRRVGRWEGGKVGRWEGGKEWSKSDGESHNSLHQISKHQKIRFMSYFLVAYLCISAPIASWIFLSVEGRFRQVIIGILYVGVSVLFLVAISAIIDKPSATMKSSIDWMNGENEKKPTGCNGGLDTLTAGLRPVDLNQKQKVMVAPGKRIVIQGWMGSYLTRSQVPVIKLVQVDGAKREVLIPATPMDRPDVGLFYKNSMLGRSGFAAEAILPSNLSLGDYQVISECRSGEVWDQYIAPCRISVVPPEVVEPLDAPYERAAAEAALQAQRLAQQQKALKPSGMQSNKAPKAKKKSRKQSQESHQTGN